jgi:tryptophan 2,3-dioxygenase
VIITGMSQQARDGATRKSLLATVERNKIFTDLYDLSTCLISRSALPPLPPEMERRLGFYYPRQ